MNILFLTPRESGKNLGGVERHVKLLTEELRKRGHKVTEISLEKRDRDGEGKWTSWRLLWENRRFIRQADIIHIHDIFWWYFPFRFLFSRKPVFTTFHGWEGRCPPTRSAVWQKRLAKFLSDGTIGVGNFYRRWYGVETDRTVWGVLDPRIAKIAKKGPTLPATPAGGPRQGWTFVFFGRLEEVNGIEIVIEAAKSIRALKVGPWRPPAGVASTPRSDLSRYVFVGDGSWRREADRIGEVTGMVEEPWKYLVDADAVIASSYLAILEAAALGKRIIAVADNQLKRDYLEGHPLRRYFRVVKDVEGLIREIGGFYKGPTLPRPACPLRRSSSEASRRGRQGRTFVIGQTAEKLADEYEKLWAIK